MQWLILAALVLVPCSLALGQNPDIVQDCDFRVTRTSGTSGGAGSTGVFELEVSDQSDIGTGSGAEFEVRVDLIGFVYPESDPDDYEIKFGFTKVDNEGKNPTADERSGVIVRPKDTGGLLDPYGAPTRLTIKWKKNGNGFVQANLYDHEETTQHFDEKIDYISGPKYDLSVPVIEYGQKSADIAVIRVIFQGVAATFSIEQGTGSVRSEPADRPVHAAAPPITDGVDLLAAASLSVLNGEPATRSPYAWRWRTLGQ
jgi:hypothetical protein